MNEQREDRIKLDVVDDHLLDFRDSWVLRVQLIKPNADSFATEEFYVVRTLDEPWRYRSKVNIDGYKQDDRVIYSVG